MTARAIEKRWIVNDVTDLQGHPKLGSSREGFAIELIIGALETRNTYFWATRAGAELDLLLMARQCH